MTGAGSPDAYASSEKSGVGVSGGGLAGLGGAPGAAAGTGDSAANGTGRVRLSAGRGDVVPGAGGEARLPVGAIPQPRVQAEFAYLLGAEPFCVGRGPTPPHPMWVHFETFH